jgi:hypothetical protein
MLEYHRSIQLLIIGLKVHAPHDRKAQQLRAALEALREGNHGTS